MNPKPKLKPSVEKQIQAAQMHVLEQALVAFLEDVENRVPSDAEIIREGFHVGFSDTPLAVFVKDGVRFTRFYVWRKQHVVALGFLNANDPIALSIVRVKAEEWPTALRLYIDQYSARKEEEDKT